MRPEKNLISADYLSRLKASPFFLVVDYTGLKVGPINELRRRLNRAGATLTVVKNSLLKIAAKQAGIDLGASLTGQLAIVTGQKDLAAAAKVIKTFRSEFERPALRFGYLGNQRLEPAEILAIADLPPLEQLQARLLGLLAAPATRLVQMLQTPAAQLARVIEARNKKLATPGA